MFLFCFWSLRKTYKYNGTILNNQTGGYNNTINSNSNSSSNINTSLPSAASAFANNSVSAYDNSSKQQQFPEQQHYINGSSIASLHINNGSKDGQNITLPICQDPVIEESKSSVTIVWDDINRYLFFLFCIGSPFTPNITLESLDVINDQLGLLLEPGGAFKPKDCLARHHVAIVVPFRDRYAHLSIFLRNIHPFLMQQHIAYRIFIVEQTNGKPFNRAALMNIGFLEAMKLYKWDCFIFHDVDLLPLDNRNLYNCPRQPRHMSVAIDKFNYK